MNISSENLNMQQLLDLLKNLEARMARIETQLDLAPIETGKEDKGNLQISTEASKNAETLELQIGEYWFARVGIVVLAVGIAFLLTLPYHNLPPILPGLFGYLIVGGMFVISHYWQQSYTYLSRYLLGGGLVLLYFTTMRLYFFSTQPVITNKTIEVLFLLVVVAVSLLISIHRKSIYLAGLSIAMGYISAVISDQSYVLFSLVTLLSALVVFFKLKYHWNHLIIFGIIFTYFTHFIWFLNNPFLGNEIQLVSSPEMNLIFILIYALVFALGNLLREKTLLEDNTLIITTFLNCFASYGLYLLLTIARFQTHITFYHLLASLLFLGLAIIFWVREQSKYSTFFYAMLGYGALSVAITSQFEKPDYFLWLSWQSIVVITTAIWFRSKFIIVTNFIIYILLFLAYIVVEGKDSVVSLSFGIVALFSARILNWQKRRLALQTELMRNAYLVAAFFMIPYALYHLVPSGYVSLSWIALTVLYYLFSRILNNKKYRWMGHLTLLLTVFRVFIVDTTNLDPVYRVVSFLVLAIALLVVSLVYTRIRAKSASENKSLKTPLSTGT